MLKFFRNIRRKLLAQHKIGQYLKYAIGEIILVVIGILIALQINNWNNNKIQRQEEIKMLKEIRSGFESDLNDQKGNSEVYKGSIAAANTILKVIENDQPYHDSLNLYFAQSLAAPEFIANTSAFETLKSKGVDLISNDSLRIQILTIYDFDYEFIKKSEKGGFLGNQFILESFAKYFEHVALFGFGKYADSVRPYDFEALKNDREFLSIFHTNAKQMESFYKMTLVPELKKLEGLIQTIEKEIRRLE